MAKIIEGTCEKMFCLINTTEYNNDGKYCVQVISQNELKDMGFDKGVDSEITLKGYPNDTFTIESMDVNDVANTDWDGCLLIRIA